MKLNLPQVKTLYSPSILGIVEEKSPTHSRLRSEVSEEVSNPSRAMGQYPSAPILSIIPPASDKTNPSEPKTSHVDNNSPVQPAGDDWNFPDAADSDEEIPAEATRNSLSPPDNSRKSQAGVIRSHHAGKGVSANTEMDTVYTEKLVGGTAVTASSSPVTSSTTWNTIDGASLVDDDVISFEGTARGGGSISGSYTISDITSDTIQDLLTEITAAFDSDISASIDSSGQLVLTDNYEGDSQISLIFDYSETTNQVDIFGDVLTTNGDGQEGRFAMAITAINNGSDQLELTNDSYGSDNSFTIEEDTDTGLWTGSQTTPVDVDNGLDVAGTINGEAATGNGQKLTGDEDEASVDGLVIKYTGSSTGDVGEVTFTAGVAELFERTLYNITDSYEGYVAYKQDSLSDRIDNLEDNIEATTDRLNLKMNSMINRFVLMELALSEVQNMSSWLAGQLNAAESGWV